MTTITMFQNKKFRKDSVVKSLDPGQARKAEALVAKVSASNSRIFYIFEVLLFCIVTH